MIIKEQGWVRMEEINTYYNHELEKIMINISRRLS